ncbi:MAG: 2-dehydropantoate 2-reductase N-terminal domain-containing protein [Pseudomonadota bacterium]
MTIERNTPSAKFLIIGAGAMGIYMGHVLQNGAADITYLVRPNRVEKLSRPQLLYSFDDHVLNSFSGFHILSDPAEIERNFYDFIVVTIDGMALRSAEGQSLVRTIGEIARDTLTKVLLGTVGVNLRPGFMRLSGLADDQVFYGVLYTLVFQADRVRMTPHPPTNASLLAKADFAHRQHAPIGIFVDDSAADAAHRFVTLWEASGRSLCAVQSVVELSTQLPAVFPMFAACDIMGWPSWKELCKDRELWELTAAATREIQGLSLNGETGMKAQANTTADSLIAMWRWLEEETLPADLLEFNRFHHGGKVFEQDMQLLEDCVELGRLEHKPMTALQQLLERAKTTHYGRVGSGEATRTPRTVAH